MWVRPLPHSPARLSRSAGWGSTLPEIYFAKAIDNSRLVKVRDPRRTRELLLFAMAVAVLVLLVMLYAWQRFGAIEYGYRIEAVKAQRESLAELNRALRLEEASLRDPERIDLLARRMGLESPRPGQVLRLEPSSDGGAPMLAREFGPADPAPVAPVGAVVAAQ